MIFAAFFAYFIVLEQPQCYSREGKAFGAQHGDQEDVTNQFYWLSLAGLSLLLLQATVYYVQSREDMFDATRPWVMLVNFISFIWFIALQYFRFKDSGRACSGDFLMEGGLIGNPFKKKD